MKTIGRESVAQLCSVIAIFLVSVVTIGPVKNIAHAQEYSATAVLCYIDATDHSETYKGNGRTITTGDVFIWRITSDNSLMNGWEYTQDNSNLNKKGMGKIWGSLEMYPDVVSGGYFAENYNMKTKDGLVGVYSGFGSLDGVTVTYEGVPTVSGECPITPPPLCDDKTYDCLSVTGTPYEGFTWSLTGSIEGYTP